MILALTLLTAWQAAAAPAAAPVVALETSMGRITIELDRSKAPITVDNFLTYVRAGHYDGTIFHRVKPGFMAQGGGMGANMSPRRMRPPIKNESANGLSNRRGTVAMARTNLPDSATAQFFVNVVDNTFLDAQPGAPGYAVFGRVKEGMDVVDRMVAVPTTSKGGHDDVPVTAIVIKSARIVSGAPAAAPARPAAPRTTPRPKPSPTPSSPPE